MLPSNWPTKQSRLGFEWNLCSGAFVYVYRTTTLMDTFWESCRECSWTALERKKTVKNKRTWILLGGIVLISAAFLLLDFRVAVSDTQANRLVVVTEAGENVPFPMQRNDKISMVLVGEGSLVRALQKALTEKMDKAGIGEIELVQEIDPVSQNPTLVVKMGKPGAIWTPFFAVSQLTIHAGYASNGDTNFMELAEKSHTTVGNPDHSILNMYAEYEVNDRSLGLISRLRYHQFLAEYLAEEIVAALQDLYLA